MHYLPPEESNLLLRELAPYTPASIALLVQGLCDPRPEVVETAKKEFQKLQQQWENQSWHQVAETLLVLAQTLEAQKENLSPHSRQAARQLAEWILAWRPPEVSPDRLRMIAACEKLLTYLEQTAASSQQASPNLSSISTCQQSCLSPQSPPPKQSSERFPVGGKLLDPLEGFRWPGGGLPAARLASEASVNIPLSASANLPGDHQPTLGQNSGSASSTSQSLLRIREPMEVEVFPRVSRLGISSEEGDFSAEKSPRLNQAIRLSPKASESPEIEPDSNSAHAKPEQGGEPPAVDKHSQAHLGVSASGSEQAEDFQPSEAQTTIGSPASRRKDWSSHRTLTGEEMWKKGIGELLVRLAVAGSEEQKLVQAELARRGFGHVSRQLAQQLVDPDPQVRLEALRRLPSIPGVEPVAWLFWLCRDPNPQVRSAAIVLLATTKDPVILQELERILSGQPEEPIRRQTHRLRSLGQTPLR